MSNSQLEEARQRKSDEYVARELGISIEILDGHPFEIEVANHGMVWRINWSEEAPPGVEAHGSTGSQWSDISPLHERDEPTSAKDKHIQTIEDELAEIREGLSDLERGKMFQARDGADVTQEEIEWRKLTIPQLEQYLVLLRKL